MASLRIQTGLLVTLLLLSQGLAFAARADDAAAPVSPDTISGPRFYVGGDLGATANKLNFSAGGNVPRTVTTNGPVTTTTTGTANAGADLGVEGFAGGGFAGGGYRFGRFYLGGEAQADGSSARATALEAVTVTTTNNTGGAPVASIGSGNISVSREFALNLGIVGGYYVTPDDMPYVKAGYQYTQYEYQLGGSFGHDSGIIPAHGMRLAIGDQLDLSQHWATRFEYGHTFNSDIGYTQGGAEHSFKSSGDEIRISAIFNF